MNQRVDQFSLIHTSVDVKHLIKERKKFCSLKTPSSIFTKKINLKKVT